MAKTTGLHPEAEKYKELMDKSMIFSKRTLKKSGGDGFTHNVSAKMLKPKRKIKGSGLKKLGVK